LGLLSTEVIETFKVKPTVECGTVL
jgi:hypothetical protein